MTSPARSMSTVSPMRTSLRLTSSSLCRLTLLTVTPASSTGSSWAVGVSAPVLPTLIVMPVTRGVAWRGAELKVRGGAEPALLLEVVDLDDGAVGIVLEPVPLPLEALAVGDHGVDVEAPLGARVHGESALLEDLEALPVRIEEHGLEDAHMIKEDLERPRRRDRRVLLPHRAGGGVPGIGERRLAGLLKGGVEPGEGLARHVHLAADLEPLRVLERSAARCTC